jgi:hypothetical protein
MSHRGPESYSKRLRLIEWGDGPRDLKDVNSGRSVHTTGPRQWPKATPLESVSEPADYVHFRKGNVDY